VDRAVEASPQPGSAVGVLDAYGCPGAVPEVAINVFWHAKFHKAPANQWLRGLVFEMFSD